MKGIYYKEPVFRPPSEARSLLIQATEGCTHRCTFCVSNFGKSYLVRPVREIIADIDTASKIYGKGVRRIFFLDGNAMSMPFDQLLEITRYAHTTFPLLERVGVYSCGEDILKKSDGELRALADAGLKIAYVGLESGDDALLKEIKKNITSRELVKAARKLMSNGIAFSGTIINGLAGTDVEKSRNHAIHTAEMINAMNPPADGGSSTWYIGALTLMIPPHTAIRKRLEAKSFKAMDNMQILEEMQLLMENINDDLHDCVFRSNHASNYLVLKGVLSRDKNQLLEKISGALKHPDRYLRPEFYRAL
ncbi:MAG: B12-binding domain-containing radical SAM protein [Promethearchaeota archaeon]